MTEEKCIDWELAISAEDHTCTGSEEEEEVCYELITGDCTTANECKGVHGGYIYEKDGARECLTLAECEAKEGGYEAAEGVCREKADGTCQNYELENGTCVTAEECKATHYGYLYEMSIPKRCMTEIECTENNYIYDNGVDRLCLMDIGACITKDGYIFTTMNVCLTKEQCEADGLYAVNEDSRTCEVIGCVEYMYTQGDETICVSEEECATKNGIIYDSETERLCLVDMTACATRDGYVLDGVCVTTEECEADKMHIANTETHICDVKACEEYLRNTL